MRAAVPGLTCEAPGPILDVDGHRHEDLKTLLRHHLPDDLC